MPKLKWSKDEKKLVVLELLKGGKSVGQIAGGWFGELFCRPMEKESLNAKVLHLREVEKLSIRQIARQLGICRKRVRRIVKGSAGPELPRKALILDPYRQLIATWYKPQQVATRRVVP